jgi:hypothetical protein
VILVDYFFKSFFSSVKPVVNAKLFFAASMKKPEQERADRQRSSGVDPPWRLSTALFSPIF